MQRTNRTRLSICAALLVLGGLASAAESRKIPATTAQHHAMTGFAARLEQIKAAEEKIAAARKVLYEDIESVVAPVRSENHIEPGVALDYDWQGRAFIVK